MNDMHINLENATLDELADLSLDAILGQDMADVNLSSNLPDGTYFGRIESYDRKDYAAKPEEGKAASVSLNVKFKVHSAQHVDDPNVDPASLAGRVHFQRYFVTSDRGKADLVKLLLGIIGVPFNDKKAIRDAGRSPVQLLEECKAGEVYFGFTVKNTERGGFENCDIQHKQAMFIDMVKTQEFLA